MIDVTCIIPVFNDATNLMRAVDSCVKQGNSVEVIIVDDCSTDGSFQIATELAATSSGRIRAFQNVRNSGPALSRNHGAFHAKGAFLCFLDSDDLYLDGFVSQCVTALMRQPESAAVKTLIEIVNADGTSPLGRDDPRFPVIFTTYPCNMMVRKEVFMLMGGFPTDARFRGPLAGEDEAFIQGLGLLFRTIQLLRQVLVRHHNHPGSHLDLFLSRSRVDDGQILFTEDDPALRSSDVAAAKQDYFVQAQSNLRSLIRCAARGEG